MELSIRSWEMYVNYLVVKYTQKHTLLKMRGNIQYILHRQQIMEN